MDKENTDPIEEAKPIQAPLVDEDKKLEETSNMPRNSRLSKKFQKKSRNTLVLSILGIIAILFLMFRYGLPLISDASFLFGRVTSSPETENKTEKEDFLASPDLDTLPDATKEEMITITGTSVGGEKVTIYLNGSLEDEVIVEDGSFEYELKLTDGGNIIKAKAMKGEMESEFSNSVNISLIKEGPELSIDSPGDNAELKGANPIEVKGHTDPDVTVTVNDFQAVSSSNGSYSYLLTLKEGGNEIKVVAIDAAGNKTEKTIRVNYSR